VKYPIQVLFREYFEGILAAVFLALFLRFFVLNILYIPTENMNPELNRGDFVIGWRLSYGFPLPLMKGERLNFKVPTRGDVVAFRFPGDEEQIIIRRVVGLPGDTIKIDGGSVVINGEALIQEVHTSGHVIETDLTGKVRYLITPSTKTNMDEIQIPEGALFVLSDNRTRSDDSRDWGMVPVKNVESEIALIWLSVDNSSEGMQILWDRIFRRVR
jgi:signal peptidase I